VLRLIVDRLIEGNHGFDGNISKDTVDYDNLIVAFSVNFLTAYSRLDILPLDMKTMSDNSTQTTCARHPNIETNLRCSSCDTPICPKCLVQTPVGMKCKTCGSHRQGTMFNPSPAQLTAAAVVAIMLGVIVGWAVEFGGFYIVFLSFVFGGFAGDLILRASGRRRGIWMEIVAGAGMALGAVGGRILIAAIQLTSAANVHPPYGIFNVLVDLVAPTPIPMIALIVAISGAVSRIKYL